MAYKYISDISKSDLSKVCVIPCINQENNKQCIIIKNKTHKKIIDEFKTDNLIIRMNKVLTVDEEEQYVHLIECVNQIDDDFDIVYKYVFDKITNPIDDDEIMSLVNSLEEYFKITPDKDLEALRIGVYGELLTIKKLYENGYTDITSKYHKNFYSKHDVEISKNIKLEIKTTKTEKRIHMFKHNQIYRTDVDVYVASSMIEIAETGTSLYELFDDVTKLYDSASAIFELNKLKKRCRIDNNDHGIVVSQTKALNDLLFYKSDDLPRFNCDTPKGVSNASYDVDCSTSPNIDVLTLIDIFKKENA